MSLLLMDQELDLLSLRKDVPIIVLAVIILILIFYWWKIIDTNEIIEEMKLYPYMSGMTISGGEPFSQKLQF